MVPALLRLASSAILLSGCAFIRADSSNARLAAAFGQAPLSFEENRGQAGSGVRFIARSTGYAVYLTSKGATIAVRSARKDAPPRIFGLSVIGGAAAEIAGADELPGKNNYFIGNDSAKWRAGVSTFGQVRYTGILPGVDLIFHGNRRQLEYDFRIAPGATPRGIRLMASDVSGRMRLNAQGELILKLADQDVRFARPIAWQETPSGRRSVDAQYVLLSGNRLGFHVGYYDHARELVIDPTLADPRLYYSTFLGGTGNDYAGGIAVDRAGNAYVTGTTLSIDFPVLKAEQPVCGTDGNCNGGNADVFVTKFNPQGSAIIYSTYLGGSFSDNGNDIAVDGAGNAYITGQTLSPDFPVTAGAAQATCGPAISMNNFTCQMNGYSTCGSNNHPDAFVTKLDPSGSKLVYSTFLGGSDYDAGNSIRVDATGAVYIAGSTHSDWYYPGLCGNPPLNFPYPTTANAWLVPQNGYPYNLYAVFTKLNASGAVAYSTYVSSTSPSFGADEQGYGVAIDSSGKAYVTGYTTDSNFPTTTGATIKGGRDVFVAKFDPGQSGAASLAYSTLVGGSNNDYASGIAVDSSGNSYITGQTLSSDFPTTPGAFQSACLSCSQNIFVAKLNASATALDYSTYLGGPNGGGIVPGRIAVDSAGDAYVTGGTQDTSFPVRNPIEILTFNCPFDNVYVTRLNAAGSGLVFSTLLGECYSDDASGIAIDGAGNAYVAGTTNSTINTQSFPTTAGAFQTGCGDKGTCNGNNDAFVLKLSTTNAVFSPSALAFPVQLVNTLSAPRAITLTNAGTAAMTINGIVIAGAQSGDFSQTNNCGASLGAGASCTISVTFTPSVKGPRGAALYVSGSEPGPHLINLSGTGTVVQLTPAILYFGQVSVGTTSAPHAVTLKNVGATALTILGIAPAGIRAGEFAVSNNCGASVAAGASCAITVTFTPSATGSQTAEVLVYDNGGGSPQAVAVAGTGN